MHHRSAPETGRDPVSDTMYIPLSARYCASGQNRLPGGAAIWQADSPNIQEDLHAFRTRSLSTLNMLRNEHLDVRTVTLG
ncbi:hypothetical protein PZH39_17075, partial [Desulfovibrio desulfuricans]|uniref:hypothetical protein n=1 Tax=Desulfovibrio desulfuricans TaxID=876 RepID=UPI0023B1986D